MKASTGRTARLFVLAVFASAASGDLYVRFDATGKVKSYAFNTNEPDAAPR